MKFLLALKQSTLTLNEALVLACLAEYPDSSQSEISDRVDLALSVISQIINKFIRSGHIEKTRREDNGVKHYSLTEDGLDEVHPYRFPNMFEDIRDFRSKFGLPLPNEAKELGRVDVKMGHKQLTEEANEFLDSKDGPHQLDALVDSVYFALGLAHSLGADFDEAWRRVHAANMAKRRATSVKESKRKDPNDIVKPEGWTAPDLTDLFA